MKILREQGVEFDVVEYLKTPLTRTELERILDLLPNDPAELVRKDKRFKELDLKEDNYQTRNTVIDLLCQHPELMQRPILVKGDLAIIGRPSSEVEELLG